MISYEGSLTIFLRKSVLLKFLLELKLPSINNNSLGFKVQRDPELGLFKRPTHCGKLRKRFLGGYTFVRLETTEVVKFKHRTLI